MGCVCSRGGGVCMFTCGLRVDFWTRLVVASTVATGCAVSSFSSHSAEAALADHVCRPDVLSSEQPRTSVLRCCLWISSGHGRASTAVLGSVGRRRCTAVAWDGAFWQFCSSVLCIISRISLCGDKERRCARSPSPPPLSFSAPSPLSFVSSLPPSPRALPPSIPP